MAAWPKGDSRMAARIRAHDWAATPLGSIHQWPAELRIAASLVIENNFPSALVWGPDLVTIYNDGFLPILGNKSDTLGGSFADIWREAWDEIGPIAERAMAGQSTFLQDYRLTIDREGVPEEAFFTFSYSPVRGPDGTVLGMIDTVIETTAEVRSRSTLRESEARHRLLIESWAQAVWETNGEGVVVKDSPSWRAYTGQTVGEWLGYGWLGAIHPDDRGFAERQWREAMAACRSVDAEFRLRAPDGGWRWTNVRVAPLRDARGEIEKWVGLNIDIDAPKRAELALQESEERQAFLLKLSDALRPVADPVALQETTTRTLGEQLKASRVFYVLVEDDEDTATILANYTDGVPARLGRYSLSAFSSYAAGEWRAGRTASTDDVDADPRWSEAERAAYASVSTRAGFGVPLIKGGRLVALLGVNQSTPRHWTDDERELAREVAERTRAAVEQARAETALRRSEERLRALFESIDEGFSEMQVILDEEGHVVDWLHLALNANFSRVTGIPDITGRLASEVFPNLEGEWFRRMDLAYRTGEPQRFETELAELGRWFDNYITRLGDGDDERVLGVFGDITERKVAERTLRESEKRQAFLLRLSDDLRAQTDVTQIERLVLDRIAEKLSLDRAYITTSDYAVGETAVPVEFRRPGLSPLVGIFKHSDFPESARMVNEGTFVVRNVSTDSNLSEINRQSFEGVRIGAVIGVGLRVGPSDVFWTLAAAMTGSREWTAGEIALLEEVAERAWASIERARAEASLRESEARFQQFANASSGALWIRDAHTLNLEYVSEAAADIYGLRPDDLLGALEVWTAMIVPEDREAALSHVQRVRDGETETHEFQIQRQADQAFRWVRNTGFPLRDESGRVQRVGGIFDDVTQAKLAVEHHGVLLAELQHRVRNILAVVRSITRRSNDGERTTEDYVQHLEGRISALARTQVLLTRSVGASVNLEDMIRDELIAQVAHNEQFSLEGPEVELSPKAAEVLTLAIHELATNATKYGAFSRESGRVNVRWNVEKRDGQNWLNLQWKETGVPIVESVPRRQGFGSELISRRIPYELKGSGSFQLKPGGLESRIEFPLRAGDSILQIDGVKA